MRSNCGGMHAVAPPAPASLTRGMELRADTTVEASHRATMAPLPYTITVVLFSTLSHCCRGEGGFDQGQGAMLQAALACLLFKSCSRQALKRATRGTLASQQTD